MGRSLRWQDEDNRASMAAKLSSVEQELSMQRRQRRKSQAFYKRLTEPGAKQAKGQSISAFYPIIIMLEQPVVSVKNSPTMRRPGWANAVRGFVMRAPYYVVHFTGNESLSSLPPPLA